MIIYKITNLINGKIYIGKTVGSLESRWRRHCDNALHGQGTSIPFWNAIRKHGVQSFTVERLCIASDERELNALEIELIAKYDSSNPVNGYNVTSGGDGFGVGNTVRRGTTLSERHKSAISRANSKPKTPETREKMSASRKGCVISENARRKMSLAKLGKPRGPMTELTKAKLSAANKGHVPAETTIAAVLRAHKGIPLSLEHRARISASNSGRACSAETREKIRDAQLGVSVPSRGYRGPRKPLSAEHREKISRGMKLRLGSMTPTTLPQIKDMVRA